MKRFAWVRRSSTVTALVIAFLFIWTVLPAADYGAKVFTGTSTSDSGTTLTLGSAVRFNSVKAVRAYLSIPKADASFRLVITDDETSVRVVNSTTTCSTGTATLANVTLTEPLHGFYTIQAYVDKVSGETGTVKVKLLLEE